MAASEAAPASDLPAAIGAPARRALAGAGYARLEQLAGAAEADLLQLHGVGPKAIRLLREALAGRGLALGGGGAARVEELAARFAAANDGVMGLVARCDEAMWRQRCADEERTVAVVARHVADVNAAFARMVARLAAGETYTPQVSMEAIHRSNAEHAREHAAAGRAETLAALRVSGAAVARELRGLAEPRLDQPAGVYGGRELTVAQVVELVVIGHTAEHLASLRATAGG